MKQVNDRGFSFIELMIAAGLGVVLALISGTLLIQAVRHQVSSDQRLTAQQIRANFLTMLENDRAWENTYSAPENQTAFKCIGSGQPCPSTPATFAIHDASNNVFYDAANTSSAGFNQSGGSCTFGAKDPTCLFRVNLSWQPVCLDVSACPLGQIKLIGDIQVNPARELASTTQGKLKFELLKNVELEREIDITADRWDFNLFKELGSPTRPLVVKVTVESGVVIGSTTGGPAFTTGSMPSGSRVTLINKGRIEGRGGRGAYPNGTDSSVPAGDGGPALQLTLATTVDNQGDLWGGGGGGGCSVWWWCGGGGGGGAGAQAGSAGPTGYSGCYGESNPWTASSNGTATAGGNGGNYWTRNGDSWYGGKGGGPGQPGQNGRHRAGGAAGAAVLGAGYATWVSTGDRRGPMR